MENEGFEEVEGTDDQAIGEEVVVNVYPHEPNDPNPTDDKNWAHSMKRKWSFTKGKFIWCSKDGEGSIYEFSDESIVLHLVDIGILDDANDDYASEYFSRQT